MSVEETVESRSPRRIEGTLLMLDDTTPHVAVVVQAIRDGEVVATTLSNESGKYQFVNLRPGQYQLRCYTIDGYLYYGKDRPVDSPHAASLKAQSGKILENIDFHFAPFKKGTWKTYTYLDGLAGNGIRSFYCDPDGVMWFGTISGGVSRYDGKEFVNLTTRDGLGSNYVTGIYRDPDGVMWFGTGVGVSRYDGRGFVNFTTEDGLAGREVRGIHCDPDGVMWFGTNGGVSRYDGKEFINLTTKDGLAHNSVWKIYWDPDGVMWFATWGGGVSRYDGKEFVSFTTEDGLAHNHVNCIHRDPDGVMWFGTGHPIQMGGGVSRYDGRGMGDSPHFVNFTTEDGLPRNYVNAIHRDPDGVMWFGTGEWEGGRGGLSRYDGKGFVNFTTEDGLAHNYVTGIHRDPDGVMWIATWGGGISRYDPKGFVSFSTKDGLVDNEVNAIHRDPDGVMWFGTNGGVSRYDGKSTGDFPHFVNLTTKDGLVDNVVTAIHREPDGVMWFGTCGGWGREGGGISRYDDRGMGDFAANSSRGMGDFPHFVNFTTEDGLAHNYVTDVHCDPDGVVWFATGGWVGEGGISRYDGVAFVNLTTKDGLVNDYVNCIHRDPDGVMWFGTWGSWDRKEGGVSRYDGKEFLNFTTEDGLVDNQVWVIYRDPDGVMWFGTGIGVSRYDDRGMGDFPNFINFTTENGLAANHVSAIHRDPYGVMWFATGGGGVSGYDGEAWTSLDTRDGLAGNRVSSILQDPDGFLWFGTERGITRYRRSATPPGIQIISVTTDRTYRLKKQDAGLKTEGLSIPAFTIGTRVTIEYDSIDLKTIPEKRQYRCRVYETQDSRRKTQDEEPKARNSLESGVLTPGSSEAYNPPTRNTTFDWTPEKPGTYVFEVQAIDRDLNYSEPASVKLQVIPDPRNHRIALLEGELAERERQEMERIYRELEDARQIQQSLLPESPPEMESFEIAATSLPAREVSGDFYNYLPLGDGVGIVLADVTGKSVKAAMVAALADGMLSEAIKAQREFRDSPSKILRRLNTGIRPRLIRGMYAAMSLGIVRVEERQLVFSNAGMPYPIMKRDKKVWELEVNGMPLGLIDKAEYQDMSLDVEGGDFVIFYSDGVIEAENEAEEMYQTERLLEVVQEVSPALSAQEMVDVIIRDVAAFVGGEESSDDVTIVVLRCVAKNHQSLTD